FEDLDKVLTQSEAVMFYRNFSNEFSNKNTGRYKIVPRQDVEKLINMEAAFQLSDFSARAKTAEYERVLNGTQILSGVIGRVANNISVTVSLYSYPQLQQLSGGASLTVSNTAELYSRIPELVQKMQSAMGYTYIAQGGFTDADGKPGWINIPLNGRVKFEQGASGVSAWYYDVGISNKTATEQLARNRARDDVQRMIAQNIASQMKGRIDVTSLSSFDSYGTEETEKRIEEAFTNSIRTKVPAYEVLEWHIEKGSENGRNWFMAYVLVRFVRQDILNEIEVINLETVANNLIRTMKISITEEEKAGLISELEGARSYSLGVIRNASNGR
ncbi:MAG: hypothetical protein FWB95_05145, partial [Treponema sp.]|nr:hypothetical protein [Treponema sp.]